MSNLRARLAIRRMVASMKSPHDSFSCEMDGRKRVRYRLMRGDTPTPLLFAVPGDQKIDEFGRELARAVSERFSKAKRWWRRRQAFRTVLTITGQNGFRRSITIS